MISKSLAKQLASLKPALDRIRQYDAWLIFFACLAVYLSNRQPLTAGDSIPNSLIALNWLVNGRLDFDAFRNGVYYFGDSVTPYFFVETQRGHLTSVYPIGVAIVSFPIYVCFYLFLLFQNSGSAIDITSVSFAAQRLLFEQIAAAIITSLSVIVFYRLSRLKFDRSIALISTFIFAFATQTWVVSSQALWQHGASNLVLLGSMFCLWQANRTQTSHKIGWLLNAGILCGFSLSIRPTNIFFVFAIGLYALITYRRQILFFCLGLPSVCIALAWNVYHFGTVRGGYETIAGGHFNFTAHDFLTRFVGLLVSPSRGLLIYSPILLMAIPGVVQLWRRWKQRDEKLLILLLFSCLALFLQYCFFANWWAGHSYGPRFLSDLLPVLCFLLNDSIAQFLTESKRSLIHWKAAVFAVLAAFSVFVQLVGAFGEPWWNAVPIPVDSENNALGANSRLWQFQDSQIERNFRNLAFRLQTPTLRPNYVSQFAGKVVELRVAGQLPSNRIAVVAGKPVQFSAIVQNTGTSRWFGYQTGANRLGEARVQMTIWDTATQAISQQNLFISGQPRAGKTAIAIGEINFPRIPRTYRVTFGVIAEGLQTQPNPQATGEILAIVTEAGSIR